MDTNTKGKLTEIEVLKFVINKGYSVSIPFGDKDRYDQIWDINGKLLRVQIKTCHQYKEEDAIEFKCVSGYSSSTGYKENRYSKEEIDYFATYYKNQVYVVPVKECSKTKILRFSSKIKCNSINWAKNYTFEEVLEQ